MRIIETLLIATLWVTVAQGLARDPAMGQWSIHVDSCPKSELTGLDFNTSMPTSIHLDLMRHQKIPDLFKGNNWESLKWVSECNITYRKAMNISKQVLEHQNVELVFEGIDTYATVFFNGRQILQTNNAFVEYRALLPKEIIKEDTENQIKIQMYSTSRFDNEANAQNKMPFIYAHTRKACYQYSWDWAPFVNTIGVWKDIYFVGYDTAKIDYVWARNREVNEDFAIINFATALKISDASALKDGFLEISEDHSTTNLGRIALNGQQHVYGDIKILKPRFWWPNGIGDPNIYDFTVKLTINGKVIDQKKIVYGIRTIELDLSKNKFTVIVNGYPVYCKGANYVPPDMLYARLNNPDYTPGNTIENLLHDAVDSNYNMIRLWGGGQYESNELLELASRLGIMIFYDFMFSDSIYPSTEPFLKNVEVEVRQQVQRARNYPCLALWSGNNEIYQGIRAWGWGSQKYKDDFKKLFEETIPKILEKQDPPTPYISSSPIYGVGNAGFNRGGDIHYWGVWAAGANFESYKTALGPFNSQFGTQSLPVWETIKFFVEGEQDRKYTSAAMLSHQRHSSKFGTLQKYIKMYAHPSRDMEHEAYLSGLVQAFGVEIAIISQRIAKPNSWGTLYWQFNDAWPGISWSSIDYFGRWKPLQYMAKRSYPNVAIFCQDGKVTAINDNLYDLKAVAIVKVFNLTGGLLYNKTETVQLQANEVKALPDVTNFHSNDVIVYTEIIAGRNKEMWSTSTFSPFKDLALDPSAKLYVSYNTEFDVITLHTDKVIKNLFISHPDQYLKFSDNYFDMVPGKNYKVTLQPSHYGKQKRKLSELKEKLVYRSYIQAHSDAKLEVVVE